MRLKNKVALVTGGASGFGAAIARHLVDEGVKVVILDLNGEGAARVAANTGGRRVAGGWRPDDLALALAVDAFARTLDTRGGQAHAGDFLDLPGGA